MRGPLRFLLYVATAITGLPVVGVSQEPADEISQEELTEWLRAALDESLAQDDPEITRALVDELGIDAAPLIPMLLAELDRVDPATWFTARTILARVAVFAPVGQPVPHVGIEQRVIDGIRAAHHRRGERQIAAETLRKLSDALDQEQAGRREVAPRSDPAQWIEVVEDSRSPFAIELATDLLRRTGNRSARAIDALAHRLESGIDELHQAGGTTTQLGPDVERHLARALAELAPDDPRAARALARIAFGEDSSDADRDRAVQALLHLGRSAEPAIPWIARAVSAEGSERSLEDALRLAAVLEDRGLPMVAPLRRMHERLPADSSRAVRARRIIAGIRQAAVRHTLSPAAPDEADPRALASRGQADAVLDELLATDDPQRFDELLERLVGFGRSTADALTDQILESDWGWERYSAWWRAFDHLAIHLGPLADDAVRRLHAEIALRPPELLEPVIRGLLRWHPWCHPFPASEYPLLDPRRYDGATASALASIRALELSDDPLARFDRWLEEGDPALRGLEAPAPDVQDMTEEELQQQLASKDADQVRRACALVGSRTSPVGEDTLRLLEQIARMHMPEAHVLGFDDEWLDRYCAPAAARALLTLAPERLDTRLEVESLFLTPGISPQELTRAVRHVDSLDLAEPWARELLVTTARSVHQLHTPVLHAALLAALDDHRPLSAVDLAGIDLSEEQRRRLESRR